MTESNLFQPIGTIPLYEDSIGKVTLYDASHSNTTEEQRIWTVTTIASLCYGNEEAKNPEALYERLQSVKHESLWEFIRYGDFSTASIVDSMRNQSMDYYIYTEQSSTHKQNIACFRIKVPIFVARQFMRHRAFSYLELSRRYTKGNKIPFEFWFPSNFPIEQKIAYTAALNKSYDDMIAKGIETQIAARFMPQTTYTEFYCMGDVAALQNFFKLRLDSHAQTEIREIAKAMHSLLETHQPSILREIT